MELSSLIRRPLVTERSTRAQAENNFYVLEVSPTANKQQIKVAIEKVFKVDVLSVNTASIPGKFRRMGSNRGGYRAKWKKAFVRLKAGQEIKVSEDSK